MHQVPLLIENDPDRVVGEVRLTDLGLKAFLDERCRGSAAVAVAQFKNIKRNEEGEVVDAEITGIALLTTEHARELLGAK